MKVTVLASAAAIFLLCGCSTELVQPSLPPSNSAVQQLLGKDVYTVRKISSHYPHGDGNSETTLIVYEQGISGHTKELLCMFPPDFRLDGDLSTSKLEAMKIPPKSKRALDLYSNQCGKNHSCVYDKIVSDDPNLLKAREFLIKDLSNTDNRDISALAYRNTDLHGQKELLDRWTLELAYNKGKSLDYGYKGDPLETPDLTGISKVRVGKAAKEYSYSGTIGYLCEKVE